MLEKITAQAVAKLRDKGWTEEDDRLLTAVRPDLIAAAISRLMQEEVWAQTIWPEGEVSVSEILERES